MIQKRLISIVIPVYNEIECIAPLINKLDQEINKLNDYKFEIVFINDGSEDGTLDEITKLSSDRTFDELKVISFENNFGKTRALEEGFRSASGDYIITIDADLQDNPEYFGKFIKELEYRRVDMIIGNRTNRYKNSNFIKLMSTRFANLLNRIFFGLKIHDMNCPFRIMRKNIAENIYLKADYHRFIPVIAKAMRYKVEEINIVQDNRVGGISKYGKTGLGRVPKYIFDLISLVFILKFQYKPFYFFGKRGLVIGFVGFLILFFLTVGWFFGHSIEARPLFFLGILCLNTGVNFLGLGLLGELIIKNSNSFK